MEKAILYLRVSSKEQEVEGYSIPAQRKLLQEYCSKKGYSIAEEFVEVETAKRSGRPQFKAMIAYTKKNKLVKHIVVEKTDRLLRNISDYARINDLMDDNNFYIHLVKQNSILSKNSSSHEKLVFGFNIIVAKNMTDNLSEETRKGMLEKAEQRIYPSCAPYGYINVDRGGKKILKTDPTSAPYVKKMFELYATGHYSLLSLKRKMIADGMVYRNGKNFYKHAVEVILKNEFYTGVFYWKGKKYENAQHEAIISKELFRQVQSILIKPNKYKSRKALFTFSNLITCGVCGFSITGQMQKQKYIYYHCSGYKGNCEQPYLREELIGDQISSVLANLEVSDDIQKMVLSDLRENMREKLEYHQYTVQQIEKQIAILQNRIEQAYMDKLDGNITEEFWRSQTKKWSHDKITLSAQLAGFQQSGTHHLDNVNLIFELAKKASGLFKRANHEQKRKLMKILFLNCVLKDRNLDLKLRSPYDLILESAKTGNWRPQGDLNPCFRRERATS